MNDTHGRELAAGDHALLLVHIEEIREDGIRVRIANSTMELLVGFRHDEVLGQVADSELIVVPAEKQRADS